MRYTTMLVAAVAAVVGAAAFGDHHGWGPIVAPPEDCSQYPLGCQGECHELNACRAGNTPIGGSDCGIEDANLHACKINPPPFVPPVIIVTPPPACPAGQYFNQGECQEAPECGDDEIVGVDGTCTECGDGKVPNEDGTACVSCQHGESDTSGVCADDPCGLAAVDAAAGADLKGVPRQGREQGRFFYCEDDQLRSTGWSYSGEDKCYVTITRKYERDLTCWRKFPRPSSCNLAGIHTHPYFTKADLGAKCGDEIISDERMAIKHNTQGMSFMSFGPNDWLYSVANDVDSYLGVPNRSCVMGNRVASGDSLKVTVWAREGGECKPYEHVPWSDQ